MSITIKELPDSEKPYEKLEIYGEKFLSNAELLAIIIKVGTKKETSVELAQKVLKLTSQENSIRAIQDITLEELKQIKGIGRVKAIQIKAVCELSKRMARPLNNKIKITSPKQVAEFIMEEMRYEKREILKLLLLNTKGEVRKIVDVVQGSENYINLKAKDILQEPIKMGLAKFIMIHNHPSGNPTPSKEDIQVTKKIMHLSQILGLELVDHVIIGDGIYTSILSKLKKE